MSTIATNNITDAAGSGAPNFANGLKLGTNAVLGPVTGDAPMYACRAWVNFNGTGTVAIRASGNVSSITDNGAGDYTINFTTAMPDVNYAATFGYHINNTASVVVFGEDSSYTRTTGAMRTNVRNHTANVLIDWAYLQVAIFR